MQTKCPICGKMAEWNGNPTRPFCSERCRIRDLGAWMGEEYRVPADEFHLEDAASDEEQP